MTLRTVAIPDPPIGEDWQAVVPGQYVYDVTGVTATLGTGFNPDTAPDVSGNGNTGFYETSGIYPLSVAGLVAGDTARQFLNPPPGPGQCGIATVGPVIDWRGDFTMEWWSVMPTADSAAGNLLNAQPGTIFPLLSIYAANDGTIDLTRENGFQSEQWSWTVAPIIADGQPHYYVLKYVGGVATLKVDTNAITLQHSDPPIVVATPSVRITVIGGDGFDSGVNCTADEIAIYGYGISDAAIDAHYAAASESFQAYTQAVSANLPSAYWHLDSGVSTGRQVGLAITDAHNDVELVPSGFADVATPGPYKYSWQPKLPASTQLPDGTVTTVAIPRLVLPAGYTLGTRTLDIQPTDQWTDITLWWDDAVMNSVQGFNAFAYPPGATLVIHTVGNTP